MATPQTKISLQEVDHVARLARLELSAADKERMRNGLDKILGYIDNREMFRVPRIIEE